MLSSGEVAEIAKGLTKAQREGLGGDDWWHCDGRVTAGLYRKGLIERPDHRGSAPFTSLGLAVRQHILEQSQ